ncbi:hypothetical protein Pelo_18702 [Pelomyxa schiedti]|nr:hypothetical protein Pelo_18702 [Pelomyxa schiedti]
MSTTKTQHSTRSCAGLSSTSRHTVIRVCFSPLSCFFLAYHKNQRDEGRRLVGISRMVWEHVVAPRWITTTRGDNQHKLTMKRCVKIMTVAEALFPLVAKACAVVLDTRDVTTGVDDNGAQDIWQEGRCQVKYRSSYFAVECAAIVGVQKGDGGASGCWNIEKESMAVLWGLCSSNNLLAAQQLVLNPGQSLHAGTAGTRWAWDDEVRDSLRWDYNSNVLSTLLSCVCRAGHLDVAKWIVTRFEVGEWGICWAFLAAIRGSHIAVAKWLVGQFDLGVASKVWKPFPANILAAQSGNLDVMSYLLLGKWQHS